MSLAFSPIAMAMAYKIRLITHSNPYYACMLLSFATGSLIELVIR